MENEATGPHCEVCGREKKPEKRWIEITEKSNEKSGIDRVREFVSDTVNEENDQESSPSSDAEGYYEKIFYICPHLPCDGRTETIGKIEHWRMKHDPDREFSREKLEKIIAGRVAEEKNGHRLTSKAMDNVLKIC